MAWLRCGSGKGNDKFEFIDGVGREQQYDPSVSYTFIKDYKKVLIICTGTSGDYFAGSINITVNKNGTNITDQKIYASGAYCAKTLEIVLDDIKTGDVISASATMYGRGVILHFYSIS